MDKSKAIEMLKQCLEEIPQLEELHYDNQKFELWRNKVSDILEAAFGRSSSEWDKFVRAVGASIYSGTEIEYQQEYNRRLYDYETAILSIIQKHQILGAEEEPAAMAGQPPKAFIVHGGKSEARDKLCRFLVALGVTPFIIEEEPKEGRSVNEQVEYYSEQADCAIILGTADDKELKDGRLYPRRNVYVEIGRFKEKFPNKIIYLLEKGASFPSDISEKLYTRFTQESMDEAFITVARELRAFGIVKVVKP